MRISFSEGALTEAQAAADYYLKEGSTHVAARFIAQLDHALSILKQFPEIGAATYPETRSLPLNGFPFSVVYHLSNDDIRTIAVAHHRRRPGYWRR